MSLVDIRKYQYPPYWKTIPKLVSGSLFNCCCFHHCMEQCIFLSWVQADVAFYLLSVLSLGISRNSHFPYLVGGTILDVVSKQNSSVLLAHWQCVPHLNKLLCCVCSTVVLCTSHWMPYPPCWELLLLRLPIHVSGKPCWKVAGETLIYYNEQTEMLRSYTVQEWIIGLDIMHLHKEDGFLSHWK